jgi:hypothetical protein
MLIMYALYTPPLPTKINVKLSRNEDDKEKAL